MEFKVVIVIPCKNEENYIRGCLDSIINSDYDKKFLKVFVCDGLSTDLTQKIIKEYENKCEFIKLLINEKQTTPYALNLGLKAAEADYYIILGAHAEIERSFIRENIITFNIDNSIGCTGGIITNIPQNKTSEVVSLAMSSPFGVGSSYFRTGMKEGFVDTVAFGAYKKEIFDTIGYFDEDLIRNQDDEFNFRLTEAGYKIYLNPEIKSNYYVRGSFINLFNQFYQYGYWKVFVNKKHRTVTTMRQLVPFLFVVFLFTGLIASLFSMYSLYAYISIIIIYIVAAIVSSFKKTIKFPDVLKVAYTFLLLHISYGLGYLFGLVRFSFIKRKPQQAKLTR
jgi:glycosyltransferase involved in cell wall biosynthesis